MEIRVCKIPVPREECEDARRKCSECPYKDNCDGYWIGELWSNDEKTGKESLLGPFMPQWEKPDMRFNRFITCGEGKDNFCKCSYSKQKQQVTIYDIFVADSARGKGITKKIFEYLFETYDSDIVAKCIRGTTAEDFWSHVGVQIQAGRNTSPDDLYEHPVSKNGEPKKELGWYRVVNPNKKQVLEELW